MYNQYKVLVLYMTNTKTNNKKMKLLKFEQYVKHLQNIIDGDSITSLYKVTPIPQSLQAIVDKAVLSQAVLLKHKILDEEGCFFVSYKVEVKKLAVDWYERNM